MINFLMKSPTQKRIQTDLGLFFFFFHFLCLFRDLLSSRVKKKNYTNFMKAYSKYCKQKKCNNPESQV